ncbi:hypothetical protein [Streptomyces sp. VRA16 Mangrove soil]|uniref:hypothetical protein n=1 Tax=Streptomyces sp. VRA16 Mangrove soil TaxID=2817434 RepID=UPI001A9FBC06|nr:hypothetical protein [Streptomyces sp. VRA16 Mangrove soil]MBO1333162.1 hypothetical protein [Streptomyces sp. VRA16 Mangrove soil]
MRSVRPRLPDRPHANERPIAEGSGLPRAGVERLAAEGRLVPGVRLSGRVCGDFTFLLPC